jgi:hypothetical protein
MIMRVLWQAVVTLIQHADCHGHFDRQRADPSHRVPAVLIAAEAAVYGRSSVAGG